MNPLWFVCVDTARLRKTLDGAKKRATLEALRSAADETGTRLSDSCVIPTGVRALAGAKNAAALRAFVRRFTARCRASGEGRVRWRQAFRAARIEPASAPAVRALFRRMRESENHVTASTQTLKARRAPNARRFLSTFRRIEQIVDGVLGAEEAAKRVRRYVADHDAPADDAGAFERLCIVIFAQGIGYETVAAKRQAMHDAFAGFVPADIARFGSERVAELAEMPIIRNAAKIHACVENARRWMRIADSGTYLGRLASIAASDDAAGGWPLLATTVASDFARLADAGARQTLKRWGFFTAFAHPGVRRAIERLGFIEAVADGPALQMLIGKTAQKLGRDAYAVEATLALFAGAGPCKKTPCCAQCAMSDDCPSASIPSDNLKN